MALGLSGRALVSLIGAALAVEAGVVTTTGTTSLAIDPYGRLSFGVVAVLLGIIVLYAWELAAPRP